MVFGPLARYGAAELDHMPQQRYLALQSPFGLSGQERRIEQDGTRDNAIFQGVDAALRRRKVQMVPTENQTGSHIQLSACEIEST